MCIIRKGHLVQIISKYLPSLSSAGDSVVSGTGVGCGGSLTVGSSRGLTTSGAGGGFSSCATGVGFGFSGVIYGILLIELIM